MQGDEVVFSIRRAQVQDAPAIAWHRARMFQDMGMVSPVMFDAVQNEARLWTERALASGEYLGWLGTPKDQPEVIAGGAGIQLRKYATSVPSSGRRMEGETRHRAQRLYRTGVAAARSGEAFDGGNSSLGSDGAARSARPPRFG